MSQISHGHPVLRSPDGMSCSGGTISPALLRHSQPLFVLSLILPGPQANLIPAIETLVRCWGGSGLGRLTPRRAWFGTSWDPTINLFLCFSLYSTLYEKLCFSSKASRITGSKLSDLSCCLCCCIIKLMTVVYQTFIKFVFLRPESLDDRLKFSPQVAQIWESGLKEASGPERPQSPSNRFAPGSPS